jgi:hypothetical protein
MGILYTESQTDNTKPETDLPLHGHRALPRKRVGTRDVIAGRVLLVTAMVVVLALRYRTECPRVKTVKAS